MHHRESSDKSAMSEPEVRDRRYAKLREKSEASAKPDMFYFFVGTILISLLIGLIVVSHSSNNPMRVCMW